MNWVRENRFLTGFFAVMLVALGVLGWLLTSAKARYEEASTAYDEKAQELNRLQGLNPFPNAQNLKAMEAQKAEASTAIAGLQTKLATKSFPFEPMTPEQFQDKLRASVTAVVAKAAEARMRLPEKFYLGFDRYETEPPDEALAVPLGHQLKAIEWVITQLIENRAIELRSLTRDELPNERGAKTRPETADAPAKGGKGEKGSKTSVAKHGFEVVILIEQNPFSNFLNTVVSAQAPQLYVPRLVVVRNEKDKGPPKGQPAGVAAFPTSGTPGAPPDAAQAAAAAAAPASSYIVGEEKIEVTLRLEIVDFTESASK
jgi:hypothetical protein